MRRALSSTGGRLVLGRSGNVGVQFTRAFVTGLIATAADVLTMVALVSGLGWHYLVGNACSYTLGTWVNYAISVWWVFSTRNVTNRSLELAVFFAAGIAGLGVSEAAMFGGVEWVGLHYVPAKIVATGCHFVFNFTSRKLLLFRDA